MKHYELKIHADVGVIEYQAEANSLQEACQLYADTELIAWDYLDSVELELEVSGTCVDTEANLHSTFSTRYITVNRPEGWDD